MSINARHRKRYKAGSVMKPGEWGQIQDRVEAWFQRIKHLLRLKQG